MRPRPCARRFRAGLVALLAALAGGGNGLRADGAAPLPPAAPAPAAGGAEVFLVVGAPGTPEYAALFRREVEAWEKAAAQGGATVAEIGLQPDAGGSDHDRLHALLDRAEKTGSRELWLVLIGHGTFDGAEAKFNLRGPDLAASELAAWLQPMARPTAVIDTTAASAPFLPPLSAPHRVVITATRTGSEENFPRFGQFLAEGLLNPASDLDQDGQVSLLEAFLAAAARGRDFYAAEGRLATEHALLDDNGDGLGTPADWFRGTRATKRARDGASLDGSRARQWHLVRSAADRRLTPGQRAKRDALELALEALRESKPSLAEADYYARLEKILLELAKVYEQPAAG